MSFISIQFIIFLVILFPLYLVCSNKYKWVLLLIASYIFYSFASVKFLIFLLISTISTFIFALIIDNLNKKEDQILSSNDLSVTDKEKQIKSVNFKQNFLLFIVIFINIGMVFFFKQVRSLINIFNLPEAIGFVAFPLGISFYTLQSLSYTIDVYRKVIKPEKNIAKYALFISYFPQFMMGPISRFNDLFHQFFIKYSFDKTMFVYGIQRATWGFFKKLIISDRLAVFINATYSNYNDFSGITLLISTFLITLLLYVDFSSYMDIAIGVSNCFGINIQENFKFPLFSKSIQEFWTRWHITLYTWLRDYIFYPLIHSKPMIKLGTYFSNGPFILSSLPVSISILVVWILCGFWHGYEIHYIIVGLYNAMLLILFMFVRRYNKFKIFNKFIGLVFIFLFVWGGPLLRCKHLTDAFNIMYKILHFSLPTNFLGEITTSSLSFYEWGVTIFGIIILFIVDFLKYNNKLNFKNLKYNFVIIYILLVLTIIFGKFGPTTFIYLRF